MYTYIPEEMDCKINEQPIM